MHRVEQVKVTLNHAKLAQLNPKTSLKGKTLVITGGSRGIGLAIAKRAAEDGANIAILAKSTEEMPNLPGTIFSAAKEIEKAGGKALPVKCDIRSEKEIIRAISEVVSRFGGIDILVNNASAIFISGTEQTTSKKLNEKVRSHSPGKHERKFLNDQALSSSFKKKFEPTRAHSFSAIKHE